MKILTFESSEEYYRDLKLRMRIFNDHPSLKFIKEMEFESIINEVKITFTPEFDEKHAYTQDKVIREISGENNPLQYNNVRREILETETDLKPAKR